MSSEQVIAKVVAEMREAGGALHFADLIKKCWAWADRLSTPAASTGDAAARFDALDRIKPSAADSSESFRWNCECVSADEAREIIDQLQARNAELETDLRWARDDRDNWERTATALLDGIEGLEKKWRDEEEHWGALGTTYGEASAISIADCTDDLKALREKANDLQVNG